MHFVVIDKPRVCVLDLTNPPILASLIAAGLFVVMVILAIIALLVRCCKDIRRYDVLLRFLTLASLCSARVQAFT